MGISVRCLQLEDLRVLHHFRCAAGSLPPNFLVSNAILSMVEGAPAIWCSFFVYQNDDGLVVGSGGFKGVPRDGRVELGYGVSPEYWGQGIATEAARQIISLAHSTGEVTEIYAETRVDNPGSARVLQKLGFVNIGQRHTHSDGLVDRWLLGLSL